MSIKTIGEVNRFLETIPRFQDAGKAAADFSLERFRAFCSAIGNPQQNFPAIHVAGSNGKGSTCRIIASIYREAGYKSGVYTSPHLLSYSERFVINGKQIKESELVFFFNKFMTQIKSFRLTYFEIATAIAFWWFARKEVDIAIIETGLGGRLDATNIINPLISIITSVSFDHTDILGDTLRAIAREKGGIIKPGIPVVIGHLPSEAKEEIKRIAVENESKPTGISILKPTGGGGTYQLSVGNEVLRLSTQLKAPVQAYNIAMAWRTAHLLKEEIYVNEQQIRQGIEKAGSGSTKSGQFERLHPKFDWYFDGAHNVEAIKAMKQTVKTVGKVDEAILVLSLMKDKINKKMMKEFLEFKKIVYYTLTTKRGANMQDIVQWLPQVKPFPVSQNSRFSLLEEFNSELVIFGGSFYFYPTVRNWITTYMRDR